MYLIKRLLKRKWFRYLVFFISCLYILVYFHTATTFDEKYTLLLINHKFIKLITLDSLDVHPPLYYLILRYFLVITTFWTKSILIKILFARVLSLIFSVITFIYICKIFRLYGIKFKWLYQWLLFILLPNVLGSFNPYALEPLIDIRMYSLAAMLIAMEFYYLSKLNENKALNYVFIIILSTLIMYTHYFAAIISVMMILTFIAKNMSLKNTHIIRYLILSLIVSGVLYLPWLPFLYRQISIPKIDSFNMSRIGTLVGIIKFVIICLVLGIPILWAKFNLSHKINVLSNEILGTMAFTLLFSSTILLIVRPMFNLRYIYPIFLIYEFLSLDILFYYMSKTHLYLKVSMAVLLLLIIIGGWSSYYQVSNVDLPGIRINKNVNAMQHNNKHIIKVNPINSKAQINPKITGKNHQYNIDDSPINFEYAFLLSESNSSKCIYTHNLRSYFGIDTKPAYKSLFKRVENHIY